MKSLVVVPLGLELKFLIQFLRSQGLEVQQNDEGVTHYQVSDKDFILVRGAHGKVQCALKTQQALLARPEIKVVICIGAAGSLRPQIQAGDIVIGEKTVEHDYHEKFSRQPHPEFAGSSGLIERFRRMKDPGFPCHFGTLASGDEDIIHQTRVDDIVKRTGALAVAWEGAGVARAAESCGREFLEVRGITDIANAEAFDHFQQNVQLVMERLGQLLCNY